MVVLPGNQASTSGGSAAQPAAHAAEGHVQSQSQPHAHPHHPPHPPHPAGLPPSHSSHSPGNRPANLPMGPGAPLAQRKSSKLGMNVGHAGEPARQSSNEHGEHVGGSHAQPPAPAPRPRVKLLVPAPAGSTATPGGAGEPSDPSSPADSSRPSSSRATGPSTSSRTAGTGGKASGGKSGGRAMRAALRSKSMPLPEFEWLGGEDGSDDYVETTESVADEDAEAGPSGGTTASGAAPGAPPQHPLSRLSSSGVAEPVAADGVADEEAGEHPSPRLPQHLVVKLPQQRVGWEGVDVVRANSSQSPSSKGRRQLSADDATSGGDSAGGSGAGSSKMQTPLHTAPGSTPRHSHLHPGAEAAARRGLAGTAPMPAESGVSSAAKASPFHMAANSPFANAADLPWSPRPSGVVGSVSPSFSSPRTSHKGMGQPGGAASAAAAAGPAPAPAPRRVTFVSPFAQMASEVPSEAEEEQAPAARERPRRRSSGRIAGDTTASSPSESEDGAEGAPAPAPWVAAASTANSTDVHVLVEKDQHTAWGVLGACSKPASGDVYPPGGLVTGRVSPPPPLQPPSYAAMRAAAASPFAMAAGFAPADEEVASPRTEGLAPEAVAAVAAAAAAAARAPAGASTTEEEELPLPRPSMGGFAGMGLPSGSSSASDQFDDGDDDATLHTTAWVRL